MGVTQGTTSTREEADTVTIPEKYRAWFRAGGYNGPWTVYASAIDGIVADVKKENRNTEGGPQQPPNLTFTGGSGTTYGGGSAGMSAKQKANLRASYAEILRRWGIGVTKNMDKLMNQGVSNEWSTTNFMQHLRRTKEYKDNFVGIQWKEGMTESEYLRTLDQFQTMAKQAGYKLGRDQFAVLLKGDVTSDEWAMRMEFVDKVEEYRPYFKMVQDVAHQQGLLRPKEHLTDKNIWEIMTGRGAPGIERLMEEANATYWIEQAGIKVGPKGDVKRRQVLDFIHRAELAGGEAEAFTEKTFSQLAETIQTVMPAADIVGHGITKGDLFTLATGGKGADKIARQVQDILGSWEKEKQANVNPVLVEDGEGGSRLLGGSLAKPKSL